MKKRIINYELDNEYRTPILDFRSRNNALHYLIVSMFPCWKIRLKQEDYFNHLSEYRDNSD
ncbi:MAG: hypothetical protein PF551_02845 [Candidatus Marinimicrobia bacterium]|nr:hypothetical protein [Candidatus Neomarinimicrobiota bacterium]